jgi:hypothetical protein
MTDIILDVVPYLAWCKAVTTLNYRTTYGTTTSGIATISENMLGLAIIDFTQRKFRVLDEKKYMMFLLVWA